MISCFMLMFWNTSEGHEDFKNCMFVFLFAICFVPCQAECHNDQRVSKLFKVQITQGSCRIPSTSMTLQRAFLTNCASMSKLFVQSGRLPSHTTIFLFIFFYMPSVSFIECSLSDRGYIELLGGPWCIGKMFVHFFEI